MADSPLTPTMQAQLQQLLQLQTDRSARTSPIHQAAMAMAQRMAPGYAQSAMTAPSSLPMPSGSLTPSVSSPGGPGIGTTSAAMLAAALLKPGSPLLALLKGMFGGGGDAASVFGGSKPMPGGTGFPDVPFGGGGGGGDPTQPGGAQGQGVGIGLPFMDPYGGQGGPPTGASGQQGSPRGDEFPAY